MSNFFQTIEYKTLMKIVERLKEVVTQVNLDLYKEWKMKAINICRITYGDIGYDSNINQYRWLDVSNINMNEMYEKIGEDFFYPKTILYVKDDGSEMIVRHIEGTNNGRVIKYSSKETAVCKNKSISEMNQIHKRKLDGWEMVLTKERC